MRRAAAFLILLLSASCLFARPERFSVGYEGGTRASMSANYRFGDRFDVQLIGGYQFAWKDLRGVEIGAFGTCRFMNNGIRLKGGAGILYGHSDLEMKWFSPSLALTAEMERPDWFTIYMRMTGGPYFAIGKEKSGAYISVSAGVRFFTYWRTEE